MIEDLHAYAKTFPSQGGVEIGPWLERYASEVPEGSAIVEVGSWLGAGTAHLALGAMKSGAPIHVYDRWRATEEEVGKAAKYGIALKPGVDTLPIVKELLGKIPADITYYQESIKNLSWKSGEIGLYVDDATKVDALWNHAISVFKPYFIPGKTILVLMDYFFGERAGFKYDAQKRYMKLHAKEFELIGERMGGTTVAVWKYLGNGNS